MKIEHLKIFLFFFISILILSPVYAEKEKTDIIVEADTIATDSLHLIPLSLFNFKPVYFKHIVYDNFSEDSLKESSFLNFNLSNIKEDKTFSALNKSGVIYRGISIGSDKDLTINSGLNLNLSGTLYKDLKIKAVLSDKNIPLSSEGNTESLSDIENIYIQLQHPHFFSQMGDYRLIYNNYGVYGNLDKKLSGVYLKGIYDSDNHLDVAFAVTDGERYTNHFNGEEGNQGPYLLNSKSNSSNITIIPGSEKVYINGKLLKRGRNNDYTIDYSMAEVIFTNKTMIFLDDRITIDFEYSEDNYKKNIYNILAASSLLNNNLRLKNSFYIENDNTDNPLGFDKNPDNMEIIKLAGDNPDKATIYGAVYSGENLGAYDILDSLNIDSLIVYRGKKQGDYDVRFSRSEGDGKYILQYDSTDGTPYYTFIGEGGDYIPYIKLPLPKSLNIFNSMLEYDMDNFSSKAEIVLSKFQQNSLSKNRSDKFEGYGDAFNISYHTDDLSIKKVEIGKIEMKLDRKYTNYKLVTAGRYADPEIYNETGYGVLLDSLNKTTYDATLNYNYRSFLKSIFSYQNLEASNDSLKLNSNKLTFSLNGSNSYLHQFNILTSRRESRKDYEDFLFSRDDINTSFTYKVNNLYFTPTFVKLFEKTLLPDSLSGKDNNTGSFNILYDNKSNIEINNYTAFTKEKNINNHNWQDYLERFRNKFDLAYRYKTFLRSDLLWNHISSTYQNSDSANTRLDLINSKLNINYKGRYRGNLEYEINKTEERKKIRHYIKVEDGYGNYKKIGNIYIFDEYGDYDLVVLPSEETYPVTGLKFIIGSNLDFPEKKINDEISYWLSRFDIDWRIRIEEKSKTSSPEDIILLKFSKFQSDSTVFGLMEFDGTLHFLRKEKHSIKNNIYLVKRLNNTYLYNGEEENIFKNNLSFKNRFNNFTFRSSIEYATDKIVYINSSETAKDISSKSFQEVIDWNLNNDWNISFKSKIRNDENKEKNDPKSSYLLNFTPSFSYSFLRKGVLRGELTYNRLFTEEKTLPYQMGEGFDPGNNFKWSLNSDYNLSEKISAGLNYSGRKHAGDSKVIHEGSAEIRMTF